MTLLQHRTRSISNASLISMVQRFSDISIIFLGAYLSSWFNGVSFQYEQLLLSLLILVVFQIINRIIDFCRSWRGINLSTEITLVLKSWTLSLSLSPGGISLISKFEVSCAVFAQWYFIVAFRFFICRSIVRFISGILRKPGYSTRSVIVVGLMPVGIKLLQGSQQEPWLGLVVKGVYDNAPSNDYGSMPYAGTSEQLIQDTRAGKVGRIHTTVSMDDEKKIKNIIRELTDTTCSVSLIPDIFTFNILQSKAEEINGVPVVPLFNIPLNGIDMIFKRSGGIIVSSLILILISPILIIISCAVKLASKGPVIFRQIRYGMSGKPIGVWEFRSTTVMENDDRVIQTTKDDIRVTKVGKFLQSTPLDELPQSFNVFFSQISVVEPRSHAVSRNERCRSLTQGCMLRHKVRPGITGLAQIDGWHGETDTLGKMEK